MRIIFVRHAEKYPKDELNPDPTITEKGVRQAKLLAKRMKSSDWNKRGFNGFYCSEMKRARQTADIVSRKIKVIPDVEKSLNEFGSDAFEILDKNKWVRETKVHHKELVSFLKEITKNPEGENNVLIIAHWVTNRLILSHFFGLNKVYLGPFLQGDTAINSVAYSEKWKIWGLEFWNDLNHVPARLR